MTKPSRNDHEVGSSSDGDRHRHSVARWPARNSLHPRSEWRVNVTLEMARLLAEAGMPCSWPDVHLSAGWHLNQIRVPVPAIPASGPARRWKICDRCAFLLPNLRRDPAYSVDSPLWNRWFEAEHEARRESIEAHLENLDDENKEYNEDPPPAKEDDGFFPSPQLGLPDWSWYRGAETVEAEVFPLSPSSSSPTSSRPSKRRNG
jgi:hypothetical protein